MSECKHESGFAMYVDGMCFDCDMSAEDAYDEVRAQLTEAIALMERVVRRWSGSSEGLMADIYAIDDMAKYLDKC